jgi:hypothetical protein
VSGGQATPAAQTASSAPWRCRADSRSSRVHPLVPAAPHGGPVLEREAGLTVLLDEPAGTQPEFEAAAAQ